jgi:hypothetical protein
MIMQVCILSFAREGVWANGGVALRHYMDVSNQVYVKAPLHLTLLIEAWGQPQSRSGRFGEQKSIFTVPQIVK